MVSDKILRMTIDQRKLAMIKELSKLQQKLKVEELYDYPEHEYTKDWLAQTTAIIRNFSESDYQEMLRLSKTISPAVLRVNRRTAAHEIDNLIRRIVLEYQDAIIVEATTRPTYDKYWSYTNPFWLVFQIIKFLVLFISRYPILSIVITILGLLGIDYSLAWSNMHFLIGLFIK